MFHVEHGAVRRSRKISKIAAAAIALSATLTAAMASPSFAGTSPASSSPSFTVNHSVQFTGMAPVGKTSLPKPDIAIVPGSVINLVAHDSRIPVAIRNNYDTEVKVLVRIKPSNFTVTIPGDVLVSVPAQTTVHAEVPVQALSNGSVSLEAWLTTTTGIRLGNSVTLAMNVNADVESAILIGFAGLVVALVAIGLPRTLRKRRQQQEASA
jgi:hypothetical protein